VTGEADCGGGGEDALRGDDSRHPGDRRGDDLPFPPGRFRRDRPAFLRALFDAAVAAANPARLLPGRLPPPPDGRTVVVGAGKAAAAMARAVEDEWHSLRYPLDRLEGLVVTPYGHALPCDRIEVVEAAHPVPDAAGRRAAGRVLALAGGLTRDDLLLCLVSGGGSALLALPAAGVELRHLQAATRALLRSGATIAEINCVRAHLSAIAGGRLAAAAHPARVVTLLISDVPGDDPSIVASGPTVPDQTTFSDALAILTRYNVREPHDVIARLHAGASAEGASGLSETPKPGDRGYEHDEVVTLAAARDALGAAAQAARQAKVSPLILGDDLEGEARELGAAHALLALGVREGGEAGIEELRSALRRSAAHMTDAASAFPPRRPLVLLSGGETTVTVRGPGRGGRNGEYALALALTVDGHPDIWALAADTDGIDGCEQNAGALVTPDILTRARAAGVDPAAALEANDSFSVFRAAAGLIVTGSTRTNVNDFRAVLVD
jgi:hydroxypyruvate reductase